MTNFDKIYVEKKTSITNYVKYRTSNSIDTDDIVSEIFIRVYKYLPDYNENKSSINTWLVNIAISCISDHFRKENKHINNTLKVSQFVDDNQNEFIQLKSNVSTDTLVNSDEMRYSIITAFNSLKPNYREIGKLFFIDELKYDEIVDILDIPLGTVKGMISRCRAKLQADLQETKKVYLS